MARAVEKASGAVYCRPQMRWGSGRPAAGAGQRRCLGLDRRATCAAAALMAHEAVRVQCGRLHTCTARSSCPHVSGCSNGKLDSNPLRRPSRLEGPGALTTGAKLPREASATSYPGHRGCKGTRLGCRD